MIKEIIGTRDRFGISNEGIVYNLTSGKKRKATRNSVGYLTIQFIMAHGKRKTFSIHRLVGLYHIPNPDGLRQINHKNSIKTDNRVENLEWCTNSHNVKHAILAGVTHQPKLTLAQVSAIRSAPRYRGAQKMLAGMYGVTAPTINAIINNKSWN